MAKPLFHSWDAFGTFARSIRDERRFGQSEPAQTFLRSVRQSASRRLAQLHEGHVLWRAQVGAGEGTDSVHTGVDEAPEVTIPIDVPYEAARMSPDPKYVTDGRASPRGMASLYLAVEKDTALAEVRPWLGAHVSVGLFEVLSDCKIVNCATPGGGGFWFALSAKGEYVPPKKDEWDGIVWEAISSAFAQPTDPTDSRLSYAATQIIAEVLRDEGYDGLYYQSAMRSGGTNVVLFDPQVAHMFTCELVQVATIRYGYSSTGRFWNAPRKTITTPKSVASGSEAAPKATD